MSLTRASVNNPYGIIALSLVVVALGSFAFFRTPTDLFPDTAPPQVSVITIQPGASSGDVADKITQLIEKELNTISGLKRIRSTSRDEASVVTAEFLYSKKIGEAVTDVQSVVARVESQLPSDAMSPRIYRITDATKALLTLALSPKAGSPKNLSTIRLLAENQIMDDFLRVSGVGDVDVFGAHKPEVQVWVDRDKLAAYGIPITQVLAEISKQNVSAPAGTIYTDAGEYLIRVLGEFSNLEALKKLPLKRSESGRVLLKDVASVALGVQEPRSGYFGNGKGAIAVNLMRPEGGQTVRAIHNVKKELKKLRLRYPDIDFEITNDQQPTIDANVRGMRASVYQAVLLTIFIILVFLADARAAFAISLSIPLAFLSALVVLWFSPYTLNMVTLSGVIIAVGMVVDASIVVLEIIYRKHKEQPGEPIRKVAVEGAEEIFHGVAAGVFTTVVVLVPVMFAGGYTEQTMRPLNMMITATILSSLVAAFTIVPLVAIRLLSRPEPRILAGITKLLMPFTRWMDRRTENIADFAGWLLKHRTVGLLVAIPFIVFTMRVVKPLNGGELMPKMDTGIGIVKFDTPTQYSPAQVVAVTEKVEEMVRETSEGLKWVSTKIGSEPGQTSFGGGGETAQAVALTITLEDRKHRKATIWEIENRWREGLRKIDGVRTFSVTEYGATPLSTSKAPLDILISGPDPIVLDRLADQVVGRLKGVKGLTDVRRSWYIDKPEKNIEVDPDLARLYGVSPADVAQLVKTAVKGVPAGAMRLKGSLDVPIRVQYDAEQINSLSALQDVLLPTPKGTVPLRSMATVSSRKSAPFITRENLSNTIDITGIPDGLTIAQVGGQVKKKLQGLKLPADYGIELSGTLASMKAGSSAMGNALKIGVVLLYILLVWMYKSFVHPLTIMLSILVPIAAGMWGLFLFHKPMCNPAMMGMILLAGTVVNNAILLLDFILKARAGGLSKDEAIMQAVRMRFRPIVMTATSTALGLAPLVFEMAVGMERMSPLGIVAAFGLIMGIFSSTLIYPVIYSLADSAAEKFKGRFSMKTATTTLPVLVFALFPLPVHADPTHQTMTLMQAVDYAQHHSPLLQASRADALAQHGSATSAKAGLFPQIGLAGDVLYSQNGSPVRFGAAPQDIRFADTTYSLRVEASQLLTDFGKTRNRMEAARRQAAALDNMVARTRDEVTFRVTALYHQRLMVNDLVRASMATEKSLLQLEKNIQDKLAVGKAARLDLLKVQVKLADVKSRLATLETQRVGTQSSLLSTMGYIGPPVVWAPVNFQALEPLPDEPVQQRIETAYRQRADLQARDQQVEAGRAEEKSARRSRWPTLSGVGSYGQYNGYDPVAGNPLGNHSDGWEENYFFGARLSLPLFDSGLRSGQIATANAHRLKAEALQTELRLRVEQEVRVAIAELNSATVRAEAFKEAVATAKLALSDEQKKYDSGKSTINFLLDAEAAKLIADSQYSQALHEQQIALVNLKLAVGESMGTPEPSSVRMK